MKRFSHALLAVVLGLLALGVGAVALAQPARAAAADTVITDCTEDGLDAALNDGGNITFDCGASAHIGITHVYTVTQDASLDGGGASIVIDGGGARGIFGVNSGVHFKLAHLTLQSAQTIGSDGGAIANHGDLTLDHVIIQFSNTDSSHSGGAIFSDGPVTITHSSLISNTGGSAGALFANFSNAIVHISDSTFSGNQALNTITGYGGAIWVGENAQVFITGGAITSNTAQFGGGVYLSALGNLSVTAGGPPALISGNTASGAGGGLYNSEADVTLTNVQMRANQAFNPSNAVDTYGGAIDNYQGTMSVSDTTLISNSARFGGGIYVTLGTVGLTDVQLISNTASLTGGGLNSVQSSVTAMATTFDTNVSHNGGAVFMSHGDLSASGSAFLNNLSLGNGGAINNSQGSVELTNVMLSGNQARLTAPLDTAVVAPNSPAVAGIGGGIETFDGSLTLSATTFYSNTAAEGGGLVNYASNATLANVTFSRNTASVGGGILNLSGNLVVTATTWFSNTATSRGGGLYVSNGLVTLGNDTFSANSAAQGSGLYDSDTVAPVALTNVTLSGNPASPGGGTLYATSELVTATITLSNTLVAASGAGGNCAGTLMVSHGYDLSDDGTCAGFFDGTGDLANTNLRLGPLADNGGPTLTLLPGAGSPAIDAIPNGVDGCGLFLTTDQRGAPRPIHLKCDIGAVETGAELPLLWLPLARR